MRRTTLQRKDRDELTQIAKALGGEPSTRARKDEIITLILDLASSGNGGSSVSGGAANDSKGENPARSRTGPGVDTPGAAAVNRSGATESSEGAESPDETGSSSNGGNDRSPEAEPGNRRRNRRSRDRDRDRDEGWDGETVPVSGHLDLRDEGYGFLRVDGCLPNRNDAYVPVRTIRQYGLRRGDHLAGTSRPANRTEKNPALVTLFSINGGPVETTNRSRFERLTPVHASRQLLLELPDIGDNGDIGNGLHDTASLTGRLIDLVAPIGIGQRVLVMAPRHCGATSLLGSIMTSIETNEADLRVIGLFLDQQPEVVTEMKQCVQKGEVVTTGFDQSAEDHVQTAEMVVERAKRTVERGADVVMVVDGLTALARAYNVVLSNTARAYSGNVESGAIHMPKKLFGAGRNISAGGSLTMIATLTTGSRDTVNEVVLGEFAATANTEIHLDRWANELGHNPAIDIAASVSHDEHRFLDDHELEALQRLRAELTAAGGGGPAAVVTMLETALDRLRTTATNTELLRLPTGL